MCGNIHSIILLNAIFLYFQILGFYSPSFIPEYDENGAAFGISYQAASHTFVDLDHM